MSAEQTPAPTPSSAPAAAAPKATNGLVNEDEDVYQYLVVDSGPIIRITGMSTLWKKAKQFYTVPAVLQEIRDAKARQHLETLPFELITRDPSPEGMQAVIDFSRQTGDYQSLSSVDLQVLALLYDLEREGCGDISHVRRTPKRTLGLGKIKALGNSDVKAQASPPKKAAETPKGPVPVATDAEEKTAEAEPSSPAVAPDAAPQKPKTWATLVNPSAGEAPPVPVSTSEPRVADKALSMTFGQMNLSKSYTPAADTAGQFSDAEDEESSESGDEADYDQDMSDEDCDVYVMDPDEVETRNQAPTDKVEAVEEELQSEFPSLSASLHVPYEGSDDEDNDESTEDDAGDEEEDQEETLAAAEAANKERMRQSLTPVSNSGKLYNSFRKYGKLMQPAPAQKKAPPTETMIMAPLVIAEDVDASAEVNKNQSRIIGGTAFSGQGGDVEDDGEGWITSAKEIRTMKAAGALDPMRDPKDLDGKAKSKRPLGPPTSQRAACATTDFAMQNVILQMNLELLSVDGMKLRKLKSWVTRCGACFKVYTNSDNAGPLGSKRLFCEHCGSDMMQRIAASVDGKTGRLKLHLSKKYKHNLRGTKFSLPKPGTGNRFQGDLLLREDQLLMGAWNQKVKMRSGGKSRNDAQSMFGRDIATNVGCHASAVNSDDLRVGFGRRNPNATKGGRERRGKKKKTTDKACGLRRY